MMTLDEKYDKAVWIARTLYSLGKATGSSANMSFVHKQKIYITASGTCFGTLTEDEFCIVPLNIENSVELQISRGQYANNDLNPSKELPLHMHLYNECEGISAVIHTHSHYATLWSCLCHKVNHSIVPNYTPYLKMKLGEVSLVPYSKPGSQTLFDSFHHVVKETKVKGFLLSHHGPIVAHKDLMSAYYALEELEESCRVAFDLRNTMVPEIES